MVVETAIPTRPQIFASTRENSCWCSEASSLGFPDEPSVSMIMVTPGSNFDFQVFVSKEPAVVQFCSDQCRVVRSRVIICHLLKPQRSAVGALSGPQMSLHYRFSRSFGLNVKNRVSKKEADFSLKTNLLTNLSLFISVSPPFLKPASNEAEIFTSKASPSRWPLFQQIFGQCQGAG